MSSVKREKWDGTRILRILRITRIGTDDTIPKSSYTGNISDADATTNLCKSVKSVSFYIYRHRLTMINNDFT
jgi:hypothetical protein